MQSALATLRSNVNVLHPLDQTSTGRGARITKTARLKAVAAIRDAVSRKPVIAALSEASVREMLRGPRDEENKPLGWAELSYVVLYTLDQVCNETANSKTVSRSGAATMKPDYMSCFRSVLKLALQHGPSGVLRPLVRAFLSFSHQWLTEPSVRSILADQIWQCVRDILLDDANRALLLPAYIRTWVDACFEQLTGRGALRHASHVVTNIAGDVLQILATPVQSYDTLTQSTKGVSPGKMLGGDFGYAIISERCCMMLVVAESMAKREARDLQALAFRTLTIALTDHALDMHGSCALESIIHASLKPLSSCWAEKKYHDPAVSLARVLLLLAPNDSKLCEAVRHRVLVDVRDESSSAVIRAGHDVKDTYIDTAASCFTFCEALQYAGATDTSQGLVIIWLRISFAIISGRILKQGTNVHVDAPDVLDQCSKAAGTITEILRRHTNVRANDYSDILRWSTNIINVSAVVANKVHLEISPASSYAKEVWQSLYLELREHVLKSKYSVRRRGAGLMVDDHRFRSDNLLLGTLSLLCTLDILDNSTIDYSTGPLGSRSTAVPYPLSRILSSSAPRPTLLEVEYFRNLVARNGAALDDAGHIRFQLVDCMVAFCENSYESPASQAKILADAASIALALARGECLVSERPTLPQLRMLSDRPASLDALHSFHCFFGLHSSDTHVSGEGSNLVRSIANQTRVWGDNSSVYSKNVTLANALAQPVWTVFDAEPHSGSSSTLLSHHFAVGSEVGESIERQMLAKLRVIAERSMLTRSDAKVSGESNRTWDVEAQPAQARHERAGFAADANISQGLRVILFLASFFQNGVSLGLISPSKNDPGIDRTACEEMAKLLENLMQCLAETEPVLLIENFFLATEAFKATARLFHLLDKDVESHSYEHSESAWHDLSRTLLNSINLALSSICEHYMGRLVQKTKENVHAVQLLSADELPNSQMFRSESLGRKRKHTSPTGRQSRKRGRASPGLSHDSFFSGQSSSEKRNAAPPDLLGQESESGSDDSEDFREFAKDAIHRTTASKEDEDGKELNVKSFWEKCTVILSSTVKELPVSCEGVLEACVKGLRAANDAERLLSPDSFERGALTSSIVDPSFLEARQSIWDVLFAIGSRGALMAAATDVLSLGQKWNDLESVAHEYISFYIDWHEVGKKKQYPVPCDLELFRVILLHYAHLFLGRYGASGSLQIGTRRDAVPSEVVHVVSGLMGVSEYFRTRHALRMPRATRAAYLRFGISATDFFRQVFETNGVFDNIRGPDLASLAEKVHSMKAVLCKFLVDCESIIRILASKAIPRLFQDTTSTTKTEVESSLRDNLPQISSCEDGSLFFGCSNQGSLEFAEDIGCSTWGLSNSEHEGFSIIHGSFQRVGAVSKGFAVLRALGEVGATRQDLMPFCLLETINRVSDCPRFLPSAYQLLAQLCAILKYKSPSRLYSVFARIMLPRLFECSKGVECLYSFPASLFVDENHHSDGILYDWLREQQAALIPHIIVREKSLSLGLTSKFAEALHEDSKSLLTRNVASVSLLFPMQFMGGLHTRGKQLWQAVDSLLDGNSTKLMFHKKSEVIAALLQSVSANCYCAKSWRCRKPDTEGHMGFSRDTQGLKPPMYDPLVIALAINHMYASNSDLFIVQRNVLQGSLFSEVRDEQSGEVIADHFSDFLNECQRNNITLLRVLLSILRFQVGPPSPQVAQTRLDSYFCVAMLWRMLDESILTKSANEKQVFYRLVAKGFEYEETAHDAAWLLEDVQRKLASLHERHPRIGAADVDLPREGYQREYLSCLASTRDRLMHELLATVSPVLVSIIARTSRNYLKGLNETASIALRNLLVLCSEKGLWSAIFANGPYPYNKQFKDARKIYEKAMMVVEVVSSGDEVETALTSLSRFQGIYRQYGNRCPSVTAFACLQELHKLLSEGTVRNLSKRIRSEAWVRSSGLEQVTVPLLRGTLSCLVDVIHGVSTDVLGFPGQDVNRSVFKATGASHKASRFHMQDSILQEVTQVLSVLGLLHPQSAPYIHVESHHRSIPNLRETGKYEDVESGIRLSFRLLHGLIQSSSAVQSETALQTLVAVLRSPDGKHAFARGQRDVKALTSFKTSDRSSSSNHGVPLFQNPQTGESIPERTFPSMRSSSLWSLDGRDKDASYQEWMRLLCAVLAKNCRSTALKSIAAPCFCSYDLSVAMLPYLLMDIICDLEPEKLSELSGLLKENIITNPTTPTRVLRTFVHVLDVLCQIGLGVVYSKGFLSWLRNTERPHASSCYYILELSYLEAAKAALKSGAYLSVLRFAQLYVDQRVMKAEQKQSSRKTSEHRLERHYSSGPLLDPVVENVERVARERVKPLVREAMSHIGEPDGIRAFGDYENLAKSAAGIATLDEDWSRSLAASEIVTRNSGTRISRTDTTSDVDGIPGREETVSCIRRELDIFRSFIGLGTLNIAIDYWDGLRNRVVKSGMLEMSLSGLDTRAVDELNDFRYAAAWKLEHWESPNVLSTTHRNRSSAHILFGFHDAVYRTLRSFKTGRVGDIRSILSNARIALLRTLRDDSSGVSAKRIFVAAARLRVFHTLEQAAQSVSKPSLQVRNAMARRVDATGETGSSNPFSSSARQGGVHHCTRTSTDGQPEDVIEQMLGGFYGVDERSTSNGVVLSRDAFQESILAEDLPVVLTRCLGRGKQVANAAATISARILDGGGVGAWARAAACLGTVESSFLCDATTSDKIAWRMQEARLRWYSSHDAPSRKQALAAMKGIILQELGGKGADRNTSGTPESSGVQQSLSWQESDTDGEMLAFLRSEACCLAAKWALDMKTHEPTDLFQTYLEAGLSAVSSSSGRSLAGRTHFEMASFADAQISNIDSYRKSRDYDDMVFSVKEMEEKIERLKAMKQERLPRSRSKSRSISSRKSSRSSRSQMTSGGDDQIAKDLEYLIRAEQRKALQERARLEKLNETYQQWQLVACTHFAACLRHCGAHDLRAAFRMVALWLDSGVMRSKITVALTEGENKEVPERPRVNVPVAKLLPLAPQLASRLNFAENIGPASFQGVLSNTIKDMAAEFPAYCLWQLLALSNATRDSGTHEKYSSLYRGDKEKKDAADEILKMLQARHGGTVVEMQKVADAYILLSEIDSERKKEDYLDLRGYDIVKLGELKNVPVPTVPLPMNGTDYCETIPHIVSFERRARVCSGLSKPLRVVCIGSDGNEYPQMVKGRDDLRGDAVMEQIFTILNSLLQKDPDASQRSLHIRTYRIIPLSPFSGIMQFVNNTKQLKEVLVENESATEVRQARGSLHERYRPSDAKHSNVMRRAFHELKKPGGGSAKVVAFLSSVWHRIQPAFHFFFLEQWPDPSEWFSHQLSYSRSVAVMSMVGFILGLGDRHLSNILLDVVTGEVVHIDFGIAFEQGKLLPTPEHMAFRLTRDIVDGFGIAGVEGVFRRCSEITLSVMRRNKDVLLTVVEVLLHDPMYTWALTPEEVLKEQGMLQKDDEDYFGSERHSRSFGDSAIEAVARQVGRNMNGSREAQRALSRISEKLDGMEGTERLSVEAQVARLIDEARAFYVLAPVFPGWCPWL